ncbi:putative transcriptional regulatory protein C15D4.02 [Fusarium austroafricanum]|uniref:Putative transcriptional regulatory protein C15D4.02 n=1 Tax=Fusarium austroafricanum TaxID=2364996 RepID=A0A8H4K4G9_9HYPO|nr:putative transcriptional regulatory protein C15D4.02 [Fusarium austroafricanum]
MRPIIPLYQENSPVKPPSRILPPKVKKAARRWERAGKPKSRSGCGTCKIRKVKCDETRPICSRCAKGKFDCDGYADDAPDDSASPSGSSVGKGSPVTSLSSAARLKSQSSSGAGTTSTPESNHSDAWHDVAYSSPSLASTHSLTYFEHFHHYANLSNGVFYYSESFSNTVLQESLQDECIRNAVFAIGSFVYGEFLLSQPGTEMDTFTQHRQESLHFYKSALTTFRNCLKSSRQIPSRWIVLMSPLLVIYELLQGDFDGADRLLGSALEVLRPLVNILQSPNTWESHVFGYTSMQIEGDVAPFFTMASTHNSQKASQWASVVLVRHSDLSFPADSDANFSAIPYTDPSEQSMSLYTDQDWSSSPGEYGTIDPQLLYDA